MHCTSCGKRIVPGEALASDGGRCCHCIRLSMVRVILFYYLCDMVHIGFIGVIIAFIIAA